MTAVPDDILKAIAVAVEAQQSAYAFDAQIAEDSLKYSNWMSALAVAILLTIASSFSDLRLLTLPGIAIELPLICMLILLLSCLVIGGIYHKFVLNQLKIKRQIMTLGLKQHSILLSSDQSISSGISLCRQVWDLEFLSDKDKTGLKKLSDSDKRPEWLLIGQMLSIALAAGTLFVVLLFGVPLKS